MDCTKDTIENNERLALLVERDHADELRLLLKHDHVDSAALDEALHVAAALGHVESCRLLLNAGANINAAEETERHVSRNISSAFSREQSVRQAWLQGHTAVGGTPLHRAVEGGHVGVVTLLLQHDADVNATDSKGITPLMLACMRRGTSKLVRILTFMPGCDVNRRDARMPGRSAMHFAGYAGDPEVVAQLLRTGADVDVNDEGHNTPLHLICSPCMFNMPTWPERQETACASMIIQSGCFVNLFNLDGETPLHRAVQLGDADLVDLLLEHNALVHVDILRDAVLTYKSPLIAETLLENFSCFDEAPLVAMLISLICTEKSQWMMNIEGLEEIDHELAKILVKSITNIEYALQDLLLKDPIDRKCVFGLEYYEQITDALLEEIYDMGLLGFAVKHGAYGIAHLLYLITCQPTKIPALNRFNFTPSIRHNGLIEWLPRALYSVVSLKMLCRRRVRNIYKQEAFIMVPDDLQDFIELNELDEVTPCDLTISRKREESLQLLYSSRQRSLANVQQILGLYRK